MRISDWSSDVCSSDLVTLEERRAADGLDAYVPRILCDGELYDADVDRFFLDLPLNGVRSRHSLRAYGYDIMVWLRFLTEVCDKTVWEAARADVEARSEEHTSELQSLMRKSYDVFSWKKKKKTQ